MEEIQIPDELMKSGEEIFSSWDPDTEGYGVLLERLYKVFLSHEHMVGRVGDLGSESLHLL